MNGQNAKDTIIYKFIVEWLQVNIWRKVFFFFHHLPGGFY